MSSSARAPRATRARGTRVVQAPVRRATEVASREHRADTVASLEAGAARHHVLPIALEPAGPLPAALRQALAEPASLGPELPLAVHTGMAAGRAATAAGAEAFTLGRHVVFAPGRYRPATASGARLLAHELAHADEQADTGVVALDRKTTPAPPDPYKPLKDAIAEQARHRYPGILGHLQTLQLLQAVADAVEAHDAAKVKTAIAAFVARDTEHPLDPAHAVLLRDVPMVLVTRTFLLGLAAESQRLEAHFYRDRKSAYDQPTRGEGHQTRYAVLTSVVETANSGARFDDVTMASAALDTALMVIGALIQHAGQLDLRQVRRQRDLAASEAMGGLSVYETHEDPGRSESAFFGGLLHLVDVMIPTVQRGLQVLMDAAIAEVESQSSTHTALSRAKDALTRIRTVVSGLDTIVGERRKRQKAGEPDPGFGLSGPLDESVDITRSDFEHSEKRHLDYFDRSRRSPSVKIEAFNREETSFSEKSMDVSHTLDIRSRQIAFLERLAGLTKDKAGKPVAESVQDAATLKSVRGFKLHSDDSWRQFLLTKFRAAKKDSGDDWKALVATVQVLQQYLNAFTTHTPYNIDEFGDNYLARTFPRAMTGQLIHDCGVYALRVAYMLSLVREELHLTFRAAIMPVHIGLVITFGDDVSKGALYVNNNIITIIPGASSAVPGQPHQTTLSEIAEAWRTRDPTGAERKAVPLDAKALHAEIAGATFTEGADVPVGLIDVPATPAGPSAAANKQRLWDWYHKVIKSPAVRPVKGTPQPELQYLGYLDTLRAVHNQIRVPTYLRAHQLFRADEARLRAAAADLRSTDKAKRDHAQAVLHAHREALVKIFQPLVDARARASIDAEKLGEFMREHPGATGAPARLRSAKRLDLNFEPEIETYLGTPGKPGLLEQGQIVPDGWSDPARLPGRTD